MPEANHWIELLGVPDGGVGKGTEGAEEVCRPMGGEQRCQQARAPGAPGDWTTNQRIHMEGPMALAMYVAEDGLVGHQGKSSPWAPL
jgi:hypothetical protein